MPDTLDNSQQIYSATYSNVPVFEFVTPEGPIMRRKHDSWINATHILKIAKFPKAKRTRILEKDVQIGIHEKVQGGYGKYQGTYVPLSIGKDIAKSFDVYDVLQPIFDFEYIEGKSATPPPAPKHSHASASNVARRQAEAAAAAANDSDRPIKRIKTSTAKAQLLNNDDDKPKKRGRPKRVTLSNSIVNPPRLQQNKTTSMLESGPSIGTFTSNKSESFSHPSIIRQDTEQDVLQVMANNMNVKNEDLELAERSSDDDYDHDVRKTGRQNSFNRRINYPTQLGANNRGNGIHPFYATASAYLKNEQEEEELMTVRELFGTPRDSFERIVQQHNNSHGLLNSNLRSFNYPQPQQSHTSSQQIQHLPSIGGGNIGIAQDLLQYHHNSTNNEDFVYADYFKNLLNFLSEDNLNNNNMNTNTNGIIKVRLNSIGVPERLLTPPQPLSKININQPIDNDGNTLFHWACSMGNVVIIEFVLSIFSNFINPELKNFRGETPLMFLVKFINSFQLRNFDTLLDILFDSLLSIDNNGKTVLHHIASIESHDKFSSKKNEKGESNKALKKNRERFSRYYMETIFKKIIEFQEFRFESNDEEKKTNLNLEDKQQLIEKFINHQDNDGNTAFHIICYNLNKKCIKVFISYHKYINFSLRNSVNYTVEDYLASHNYVLRLDTSSEELKSETKGKKIGTLPMQNKAESKSMVMVPSDSSGKTINGRANLDVGATNTISTSSFESQLYYSKLAINLQNNTANLITEKLTELSFIIDKELREQDERLLNFLKYLKYVNGEKLRSQKNILKLFKLDYLIDDDSKTKGEENHELEAANIEEVTEIATQRDEPETQQEDDEDDDSDDSLGYGGKSEGSLVYIDNTRDELIQEEIDRLVNDLSFQYLTRKEELREKLVDFNRLNEKLTRQAILNEPETDSEDKQSANELAIQLQKEILQRQSLAKSLTQKRINVPIMVQQDKRKDEFKENNTEGDAKVPKSIIEEYSPDDKLSKYCKLISSCCGMNINEVETSIDLIEQSLLKSNQLTRTFSEVETHQ